MLRTTMIFGLIGALAAGVAGAQSPDLEPGEWRMENRMSFGGGMPDQSSESTQCVTREQIDSGLQAMLEDPQGNCEVTNLEQSASSMRYTMSCDTGGGGEMTMDGEMEFMGDRMRGSYSGAMSAGGQEMQIRMEITGERVGDC
ncbi:DUF3617 domain-containing protein [Spiribacter halobius]|nr:DUF3617 family protein [Spiribacter halobius]UEX77446.1 DUF3617 domain-containing protein [Spiribacter halobius]